MLFMGLLLIGAAVTMFRAPLLGLGLLGIGLAVVFGMALPYASGVVYAVIVMYTAMTFVLGAVLLYLEWRRAARRRTV